MTVTDDRNRLNDTLSMSSPSMRIIPPVASSSGPAVQGSNMRRILRRSVLLPLPVRPTTPTVSPGEVGCERERVMVIVLFAFDVTFGFVSLIRILFDNFQVLRSEFAGHLILTESTHASKFTSRNREVDPT